MLKLRTAAIAAGCIVAAAIRGPAAEPAPEPIRNVTYVTRADGPLRADVYRPRAGGPVPGVLCVHGGAWTAGNKNQLASVAHQLAAEGLCAVLIEYRLAPAHKFPAQIEDCRDALGWMRQQAATYLIDAKRLGAWGYSAGGQLVMLLAVEGAGLKAVVAGGAPCDFRNVPPDSQRLAYWLGGTRAELPEAYNAASPAAHVRRGCPPVWFYHGQEDHLVPVAQPSAMVALLKGAGTEATLYSVPQAGHVQAFMDRSAVAKGIKFLKGHL